MATEIDGTKTKEAADKPLENEYVKILNNVKDRLARDMDPDQMVVKMAKSNVFSPKDEEDIKGNESKTRWDRSVTMLEILPRRGFKAYEAFKEALISTDGQTHLANMLLAAENKELRNELEVERQNSLEARSRAEAWSRQQSNTGGESGEESLGDEESHLKILLISEFQDLREFLTKLITSKTDGDKKEINAGVQNLLTKIKGTQKKQQDITTRFVAFESKLPILLQEIKECIVNEILKYFNKTEGSHPNRLQMQLNTSDRKTVQDTESATAKELKRMKKKFDHLEGSVYFPRLNEQPFQKKCCGVLCALKPSGKLIAKRSSERKQEKNVQNAPANCVFDHSTGTTSGTDEGKDSWWSVDLGSKHRLFLSHYELRHGKPGADSLLTEWQLQGSIDEAINSWENIETIFDKSDPQFSNSDRYISGRWSVGGKRKAYRYFRIKQTRVNKSGKYGIFLSGIELYGTLLNI